MKNIFSEMLRHPIAAIIVVGIVGNTIVGIIAANKGIPGTPFFNVSLTK